MSERLRRLMLYPTELREHTSFQLFRGFSFLGRGWQYPVAERRTCLLQEAGEDSRVLSCTIWMQLCCTNDLPRLFSVWL